MKKASKTTFFKRKKLFFSASYTSILDPCHDRNMPLYATAKELKKKKFTINNQNITQENGIHVIFMLEMKHQKYAF